MPMLALFTRIMIVVFLSVARKIKEAWAGSNLRSKSKEVNPLLPTIIQEILKNSACVDFYITIITRASWTRGHKCLQIEDLLGRADIGFINLRVSILVLQVDSEFKLYVRSIALLYDGSLYLSFLPSLEISGKLYVQCFESTYLCIMWVFIVLHICQYVNPCSILVSAFSMWQVA